MREDCTALSHHAQVCRRRAVGDALFTIKNVMYVLGLYVLGGKSLSELMVWPVLLAGQWCSEITPAALEWLQWHTWLPPCWCGTVEAPSNFRESGVLSVQYELCRSDSAVATCCVGQATQWLCRAGATVGRSGSSPIQVVTDWAQSHLLG
jgi:hypothetical protein